eukprot:PITA_03621
MYDISTHKVFASRDVIFHEHIDKQIKEYEHSVWKPLYDSFKEEEEVLESTQAQEQMHIPEDIPKSQSPQRSDEGTPQRRRREDHSDSDWARNPDDRKSTAGYVFNIGSGVVSWSSKKQATFSLSSIGAEYKALCSATYEVIWLRRILEYVGEGQQEPTVIRCDNQSTIKLGNNPVCHARSNHIDTQYHFVREKI